MVSVDMLVFWLLVFVVFAGLSLLLAPDSRDIRRPAERSGSWAPLGI